MHKILKILQIEEDLFYNLSEKIRAFQIPPECFRKHLETLKHLLGFL